MTKKLPLLGSKIDKNKIMINSPNLIHYTLYIKKKETNQDLRLESKPLDTQKFLWEQFSRSCAFVEQPLVSVLPLWAKFVLHPLDLGCSQLGAIPVFY